MEALDCPACFRRHEAWVQLAKTGRSSRGAPPNCRQRHSSMRRCSLRGRSCGMVVRSFALRLLKTLAGSRLFGNPRKAPGYDAWLPWHMQHLPSSLLEELYRLCQLWGTSATPNHHLWRSIYVLLDKPTGGQRPIGHTMLLVRLWSRAAFMACVWSLASPCWTFRRHTKLRVRHADLIAAAQQLGIDEGLIAGALRIYNTQKVLVYEGQAVATVQALGVTLIPGCLLATFMMKLVMAPLMERMQQIGEGIQASNLVDGVQWNVIGTQPASRGYANHVCGCYTSDGMVGHQTAQAK
eukprot:5936392-Amphidinium_carterae.6